MHLLPLADVTVVPSIFPEAFGMVAAEAAAAGSPPLVARHSGLAEVAAGLEQAYPERFAGLASFETGNAQDLAAKLERILALSPEDHDDTASSGAPCGRRALVVAERRRRLLRPVEPSATRPPESDASQTRVWTHGTATDS